MDVDYTALLYLGKQFESVRGAEEFYLKHSPVTDEEEKEIEEDGLEEFLSDHPTLSGTCTNYYVSNPPFILGFDLKPYVRQAHLLPSIIKDKAEQWKTMFGDEKYDIIHTVKVR